MDKTIFYIAKKEYMDNLRNYWILTLSIIFAILVIVFAYFGSTGSTSGWRTLEETINILKSPVGMIIPIVSLMLGYAAVVREVEEGSMSSLLSFPVKRYEVIVGKFLGLGCVLATTTIIGFTIAGVIIGLNTNNVDYGLYFLFIGATIILGLEFLSISIFLSSIFKRRTSAMGAAIFVWILFMMIFPILVTGILFVTLESSTGIPEDLIAQIMLIDPLGGISYFNNPYAPQMEWVILSYLGWLIIPLILTFIIFQKKDI